MFRPTWTCGLVLFVLTTALAAQEKNASHDPRLFPSAEEQQTFADNVKQLFDSHEDLSKARRQHQSAKRRHPRDPRPDYAMGLVLLKEFEYEEAGKQFQAAAKGDAVHYLPAWQAVIHLDILQKDREGFLRDTFELAKLAADPGAEWIGTNQPRAAATWLGEVCEYLKLPGVDFLKPDQQTAHVEKLTELMTPEMVAAWVEGQPKLRQKYVRVFNEIHQEQQQMKQKLEQSADRKTAALSGRQQELDEKQDDARKSATEWKAWYDKHMKQTETQLKTLQRDYAALDAAARRLSGIIAQTQFEIGQLSTVMQLQQQNQGSRAVSLRQANTRNILLGQRQQELLRYQLQYAALEQKAMSLTAQARQVLSARQQAAIQYKNATGEIVRTDKTLDRWKKTLEKSSIKAAAKADEADPVAALEKRRTMVSSYFPLDFDTEKTRVLKSYESP